VEGGGLTVNGVSRNRGGFVKYDAIEERFGITAIRCHGGGITLLLYARVISPFIITNRQTLSIRPNKCVHLEKDIADI
jgi:hypothetical protein